MDCPIRAESGKGRSAHIFNLNERAVHIDAFFNAPAYTLQPQTLFPLMISLSVAAKKAAPVMTQPVVGGRGGGGNQKKRRAWGESRLLISERGMTHEGAPAEKGAIS